MRVSHGNRSGGVARRVRGSRRGCPALSMRLGRLQSEVDGWVVERELGGKRGSFMVAYGLLEVQKGCEYGIQDEDKLE